MSSVALKLARLVESLEAQGADPARLDSARCALNFKRSWLDLAQVLVTLQASRAYESWGYPDLFSYCDQELALKRSTVDKLTVSFSMLQRHAPDRLSGESEADRIPGFQSLDYLARACGEPRADGSAARDAPSEPISDALRQELHSAVFDEDRSVYQLRQAFDERVRPRSDAEAQLRALRRASGTAGRLLEQLAEVEGLDGRDLRSLNESVTRLQAQMEAISGKLKDELGEGTVAA